MRGPVVLGPDWVRPWWLEHDADPACRIVGNLSSPHKATVDPAGLVTAWPDGWSLDWWIGADDRWHVPSREVAVRQRLLGAAPVVETAMRVPGGDAVHRAYAIRAAGGGHELVVVEIENRSSLPFAVALAVRPYTSRRLVRVRRIAVEEGTTVTVDGRVALLLPRPPARAAASTLAGGDSAGIVLDGRAGEREPSAVRCRAGRAQAAFVYPLAHTATLRVLVPLVPARRAVPVPVSVPSAEAVARGWAAHSAKGLRVQLPDPTLGEAVDANRRLLLLAHHGDHTAAALGLYGLGRGSAPTWARPEAAEQARAAADFLTGVRMMLLREEAGRLALCPSVPGSWRGQPLEVHDAPTAHGTVSFAVRWHGDRPALLWELRTQNDSVRLTAPGLDRGWSTTAAEGEALLGGSPGPLLQGAPEQSFG